MRVSYVLLIIGVLVVTATDGRKSSITDETGQQESVSSNNTPSTKLTVGLIVPHTNFGAREYMRAINRAIGNLHRGHNRTKDQARFTFLNKYEFTQRQVRDTMMKLTPSPTGKYSV